MEKKRLEFLLQNFIIVLLILGGIKSRNSSLGVIVIYSLGFILMNIWHNLKNEID